MLSDRLTAGLLKHDLVRTELYEFLGFQEIFGALSLLLSTTLLVLTIFVKRLKQGTGRVRQAGRQLSVVCTALQELKGYCNCNAGWFWSNSDSSWAPKVNLETGKDEKVKGRKGRRGGGGGDGVNCKKMQRKL
jgi:hypothetical protein